MKKMIVLMSLFASSIAMAQIQFEDSDTQAFVDQLKAMNGRSGKIVSSYDSDNTGKCKLAVEDFEFEMGDEYHTGTIIKFEDTGMYFEPSTGIDADASVSGGGKTIVTETSSKRPGGDACGDFGGALGYKKQITVEGKSVTIRETFRCALDGFKKYDLATTCKF